MRVLSWNLFHGRSSPPAGRPLLVEFAATIAGWDWDLALLQEVPPWWPPALAHASGASAHTARTSRNALLPLRRAVAARNPDLLGSWGGGANAILSRVRVRAHEIEVLTRRPERRVAHAVLTDRGWVVNLHTTTEPKARTRADVERAAARWPDAVVLGGDFNLRRPQLAGLHHLAGHHVDHLFARGPGTGEVLERAGLSDHHPIRARLA